MTTLVKCKNCFGSGTTWGGKSGKCPRKCPVCKGAAKV